MSVTLADVVVIDRTRTGGPTGVHHGFYAQRPATIGDLIEALQAEGAIDYEAAAKALYGNRGYDITTWPADWEPYVENVRTSAKAIVDAALGLDTLASREENR